MRDRHFLALTCHSLGFVSRFAPQFVIDRCRDKLMSRFLIGSKCNVKPKKQAYRITSPRDRHKNTGWPYQTLEKRLHRLLW
ncbi:hypothetical protein D3C80_711690 [compost metagenome]